LPLHHLQSAYFRSLSVQDWDKLVLDLVEPLHIPKNSNIFQSGCGAGAFLDSLQRQFDARITGADWTPSFVEVAKRRLNGTFYDSNARQLDFVPSETFDYVLAFSVFQHFSSPQDAKEAFAHMVRITKTGGWLLVAHVNDAAKESHAPCLGGGLFLRRQFWDDLAQEMNLDFYDLKITKARDTYRNWNWFSYDPQANFQYHVYAQKRGIING